MAAIISHRGRSVFCLERKSTFHILSMLLITHTVQSIAQLAMSVDHLSGALNSSARDLELMNNAQIHAVRATDGLAGTLQRMNNTVLNALIDINATAFRVNQAIGSYSIYSNLLSLPSAIVIDCEDDINSSSMS